MLTILSGFVRSFDILDVLNPQTPDPAGFFNVTEMKALFNSPEHRDKFNRTVVEDFMKTDFSKISTKEELKDFMNRIKLRNFYNQTLLAKSNGTEGEESKSFVQDLGAFGSIVGAILAGFSLFGK